MSEVNDLGTEFSNDVRHFLNANFESGNNITGFVIYNQSRLKLGGEVEALTSQINNIILSIDMFGMGDLLGNGVRVSDEVVTKLMENLSKKSSTSRR